MAWENELIIMLRHVINDIIEPFTYSDDRLSEVILLSALDVNRELDFDNEYSADIDECSLSPDPTEGSYRDEDFMVLTVLRAACFIDQSTLKTAVQTGGVRIRQGNSEIDTKDQVTGLRILVENGSCKMYEEAKLQYQYGKSLKGRLVVGPFTGEDNVPVSNSRHIGTTREDRTENVDSFFN